MVKQPSSIFENHIMLPCCVAEASSDVSNTISSWSQILQSGTREVFLGSGMCLEWSLQLAFSSTCQSKLTNRKAPQFQSKGLEIFQWITFFPKIPSNFEESWISMVSIFPGKTCKIVKRVSCGSKPHALKLLLCGRFPPANADSPGDFWRCVSSTSTSCFMLRNSPNAQEHNFFQKSAPTKKNKHPSIPRKTCDCPSSRSRISRLSSVLVSRKSSVWTRGSLGKKKREDKGRPRRRKKSS